jgi:hypothetical protein
MQAIGTGRRALMVAAFAVFWGVAADAQQPQSQPTWPPCLAAGKNLPVSVTLAPPGSWASVRCYFRANAAGPFYFLEMRASGEGRFVAVLPKPEPGTRSVELYIAAKDAEGKELRTANVLVEPRTPCELSLDQEQERMGQTLVVGETSREQRSKPVVGFLCDGIISRITWENKLVADEVCRKAATKAAESRKKVLVPLVLAGAGGGAVAIIRHEEKKEASPSRP